MKEKKLPLSAKKEMESLCFMSPKSLPDYLTIEGEITTSFTFMPIFPQSFAGSIEEKNIGRIFFGEDELDYATLQTSRSMYFNSDRLRATKLAEVYLEEKSQSPTASHGRPHELLFLDEPSNDLI